MTNVMTDNKRQPETIELRGQEVPSSTMAVRSTPEGKSEITDDAGKVVQLPKWMRHQRTFEVTLDMYAMHCRGSSMRKIAKDFKCKPESVQKALKRALEMRKILFITEGANIIIQAMAERNELIAYGWAMLEDTKDMNGSQMVRARVEVMKEIREHLTAKEDMTGVRRESIEPSDTIRQAGGSTIIIDARGSPIGVATPKAIEATIIPPEDKEPVIIDARVSHKLFDEE